MKQIVVFWLVMITAIPASAEQDACRIFSASGNAEYPPYLWRSPQKPEVLTGAIAAFLQKVAKELDLVIDLQYSGPWGRTQEEVAAGRIDFIAGAFYTAARSERMDYLRPAFQLTRTVVWVNNERPFEFNRWEDLIGRQGVTVIHNSFGQEFDEFSRKHLTVHQVGSLEQGLRMLNGQRVDYMLYEENPARAYAARNRYRNIHPLEQNISSEPLYLTLSKKSACNTPELRARIERVLVKAGEENWMQPLLQQAQYLWSEHHLQTADD
ncbi:substrate-binding periplasmic protein [Thalassolituus hydrocarboniclasticus]|uniref:Transporter substrate-binding domain-containing protein n=1 Tax=Thalassolituus hydrocarboniclasticus TaxID=2742796 RepID=A0ABY6AE67_9GAMM|nr:transporter substrate-binding domain-containing protein [Thalassolituus hydrocarboniclasticus]UXD89087.1 transporter substrate-binding domain-containing protein [Thalassolituus hydrocarboniclasticus]